MITVHTNEFWTDNSFEEIAEKIKTETHQVKFGLFNIFDSEWKNFGGKWIGELYPERKCFKLFRVTGAESTSDLSVNGEYVLKAGKPVVIIRQKVHFTALLGLAGLLLCVYSLWYLLDKKEIITGTIWLLPVFVLVGGAYSFYTLKDLNKNSEEIEKCLSKQIIVLGWSDRDELDRDEDDEEEEDDNL